MPSIGCGHYRPCKNRQLLFFNSCDIRQVYGGYLSGITKKKEKTKNQPKAFFENGISVIVGIFYFPKCFMGSYT
jgi:hypothetical protein